MPECVKKAELGEAEFRKSVFMGWAVLVPVVWAGPQEAAARHNSWTIV